MNRQLPGPATGRYPITARLRDAVWTRTHRRRAYPLAASVVTGSRTEIDNLCANPNTIRHTRPVEINPDLGIWRVQVTVIDRAHPIPSPLARARRRTWIAARPAAKIGGIIAAVLATLIGTGTLAWHLWGDQITAAARLLLIGGIIAAAAVTAVVSWWETHGRNGCPGLHCAGCKGGH